MRVYRAGGGSVRVVEDGEDRCDYGSNIILCPAVVYEFCRAAGGAFDPVDFGSVFAESDQMILFARPVAEIRTVLNALTNGQAGDLALTGK